MKIVSKIKLYAGIYLLMIACLCMSSASTFAQDSTASPTATSLNYVKNTFYSQWLINDQTCMVPKAHSFEFVIQHTFGTINNGYSDLYGIYGTGNIRLAFCATPISNLELGFGLTKDQMLWDGNLKWAIMKQTTTGIRLVSITYFGNFAVSTLPKAGNFVSDGDRYSYFHSLIIARKITKEFSVQVTPSISYFNNVPAYLDANNDEQPSMKNLNVACAFGGKYTISQGVAIIANYNQPMTQNPTDNPHPNVSFGIELGTSGHTFQIYMGNYQSIIPQYNTVFNQNDFTTSRYCVGFNITRRWYF